MTTLLSLAVLANLVGCQLAALDHQVEAPPLPESFPVYGPEPLPLHPAELRLQAAAERYRALEAAGGFVRVPGLLAPGDQGEAVQQLAARLSQAGDLWQAEGMPRSVYDPALEAAVRRFQARHLLPDTGEVDEATLEELNTPVSARLEAIEVNLDHWLELRWRIDVPHVVVNIPEFELRGFDPGGHESIEMKVIVGSAYEGHETPSFSDEIEEIVFRPYWFVTPNIAETEVGPTALKSRAWFEDNGFEIVPDYEPDATPVRTTTANLRRARDGELRIRQRPGPSNSLGLVKLLFPNEHAVYLHDTPKDELFASVDRDRSHGCIRLDQPAAMAEWVLAHGGHEDWSSEQVATAMQEGERQSVAIDPPLPVHLVYFTVWVDEDDGVHFLEDVYGRLGTD